MQKIIFNANRVKDIHVSRMRLYVMVLWIVLMEVMKAIALVPVSNLIKPKGCIKCLDQAELEPYLALKRKSVISCCPNSSAFPNILSTQ